MKNEEIKIEGMKIGTAYVVKSYRSSNEYPLSLAVSLEYSDAEKAVKFIQKNNPSINESDLGITGIPFFESEENSDFSMYQGLAKMTAVYPNRGSNPYYPALGLVGEAGEVANKVKKIMRDYGGEITPEKAYEIAQEIGDVLWYCAALAEEIGWDLDYIAKLNIRKLSARKRKGTITGEGDQR
jgi:NTP pyrophosphatase (non-canonical NTP hydrolase)